MEERGGGNAGAENIAAVYRAVRARLGSPAKAVADPTSDLTRRSPPPSRQPVSVADGLAPTGRPHRQPSLDADAASRLRDIIAAVAAAVGVTPDQLISDIACDRAIEGRKIAAALMVRRLCATQAAAAERFAIPAETVADAVTRLEPTLVARAIPRTASLADTVRLVVADWEMVCDLRPHVVDIKRAVCAEFAVSRTEIESERRGAPIVLARHVAMALAQRLSARTLHYIGRQFGGRDHTTVLYAVRKMRPFVEAAAAILPTNATVEQWVSAVRAAMAASKPQSGTRDPGQ